MYIVCVCTYMHLTAGPHSCWASAPPQSCSQPSLLPNSPERLRHSLPGSTAAYKMVLLVCSSEGHLCSPLSPGSLKCVRMKQRLCTIQFSRGEPNRLFPHTQVGRLLRGPLGHFPPLAGGFLVRRHYLCGGHPFLRSSPFTLLLK